MRKITKSASEPQALTQWKRDYPHSSYADLNEIVRQAIRLACTQEQYYICAYCCQGISGHNNDTMNEHVEARRLAPNRSLDFNNIVASCKTQNQCDNSHGSQPLPLTPLMDECETELQFSISGRVQGLTERAEEAIRVLNLGDNETNNRALINRRKLMIEVLLAVHGVEENESDPEILDILAEDLTEPDDNGKLQPFAPVLINIIRQWYS